MPKSGSTFRSEVVKTPSRALFASAKHFSIGGSTKGVEKDSKRYSGEAWQNEAWAFYDTVGEYHYAVNWVGNLLSRARLTVVQNGEESKHEMAVEALESLFGGREGQSEMLRQLGVHFTVTGEAYIVGQTGEDGEDDWLVAAATQVKRSPDGSVKIWGQEMPAELLIRLWRPHPAFFKRPDAPTRAVLGILSEILQLTKHVSAQIDSRLAGAGLLLLPNEISFPSKSTHEEDQDGNVSSGEVEGAEAFVDELIEVMSTAIKDRADASALVPIVLQVPSEALAQIKHLTFWSDLDEKAVELRTEAIRRLSLGLDMPPEVLTGTGDLNHWGSWQVDEAAIKSHSEPLLSVITSSLTGGYLRPYLIAAGMDEEEAETFSLGADTSGLRMRPNRSREALELYDRGELSAEAARRENGFGEDDKPADDELRRWFTRKVASGSTTPELVAAALAELGIELQIVEGAESIQIRSEETREARPTRTLQEHPERSIPDTMDDPLTAAAEQMVFRALERAGNRLKNKIGAKKINAAAADLYMQLPKLGPDDVDDVLTDAWSNIQRFDLGVKPDMLAAQLHEYTASLIALRKPHDREALRAHLQALKEK